MVHPENRMSWSEEVNLHNINKILFFFSTFHSFSLQIYAFIVMFYSNNCVVGSCMRMISIIWNHWDPLDRLLSKLHHIINKKSYFRIKFILNYFGNELGFTDWPQGSSQALHYIAMTINFLELSQSFFTKFIHKTLALVIKIKIECKFY